jgi:hypothetical protein
MSKPDTRNRARLEILNHIAQFCLSHKWRDGHIGGAYHAFVSNIRDDVKAQPGDLIAMQSAPTSKWYLSWLVKEERREDGFRHYLLESIEDGALCWWTNVGMDFMDREVIKDHPSWRWTDRQYAFKDRWWSVCYKETPTSLCRYTPNLATTSQSRSARGRGMALTTTGPARPSPIGAS